MSFRADTIREELYAAYRSKQDYFYGIRRQLHRHPEPSGGERETAACLAGILASAGIPFQPDVAGHGIVALVEGGLPGPVAALRGDMDALEIFEETGLSYASAVPGMMHACGHDFHMSGVLAAGLLLNSVRERLPGSVKLLFQPAEEGGLPGGAQPMIDAGALQNPRVDAVFGCHVMPDIPQGVAAVSDGTTMAAVDNFVITVIGKGGHAAYPHLGIDPMPPAAQIVLGLSVLAARTVSAADSAVLSLGRIAGGTRRNVIPDSVVLEGTMRTLRDGTRAALRERVIAMCEQTCAAYGAHCAMDWRQSFAATVNDRDLAALARRGLSRALGEQAVRIPEECSMGAEDFSAFLRAVPGAFYFVGCGGDVPMELHSARLRIPDSVLGDIVQAHLAIVLQYLEEYQDNTAG